MKAETLTRDAILVLTFLSLGYRPDWLRLSLLGYLASADCMERD